MLLAALFIADIGFVITSRTVVIVAPFLVVLLGWRYYGWKGAVAAVLAGVAIAGALWLTSPHLRDRAAASLGDIHAYAAEGDINSTSQHLNFLKMSLRIVATAPLIGHGTGSIPEQFRRAAANQTGVDSVVTVNPHNQIFGVAIQLGLLGTAVLLAMWAAHLMLFRGAGLTAWVGLIVVVQNVISCLFNSHLFDFSQGWLYVFGVGVTGGMMLRERDRAPAPPRGAAVSPFRLPDHPRLLVVVLRRLGDVLLATPLMRSVKRAFPGASVDALVFAGTEGILQAIPISAPSSRCRSVRPHAKVWRCCGGCGGATIWRCRRRPATARRPLPGAPAGTAPGWSKPMVFRRRSSVSHLPIHP